MRQIQDSIIDSLKIANRNRKLIGRFYRTLAKASVFTLVRPGRREFIISDVIDGKNQEYISCFSNSEIAERTLFYLLNIPGNQKASVEIRSVAAEKLFFSAATRRFPIYLNPKNRPEERLFFSLKRVEDLLASYWAPGEDSQDPKNQGSVLKRSRRGRSLIEDANTQIPIADIDFDHYYTAAQMAGIFAVSENEIIRIIAELVRDEILDLNEVSFSLESGQRKSSSTDAARHYDPLVAHLAGGKIQNQRGDEFRAFQAQLLSEYLTQRNAAAAEMDGLKTQIVKLEKANKEFAEKILEQNSLIESLKASPAAMDEVVHQLNQELFSAGKEVAELKRDMAASRQWEVPETVMEAMQMAEARFSSRLIFHERVIQSIDDFSLKNDLRATHEAVKMFKALAECLYQLKFVQGNFSEERFRDETGIRLSMTESKASKRDRALDETRAYSYKGSTVYAYPHLKAGIQGIQVRLHFQFIENEKKILVCHFGHHLPNAMTKHLD